MTDDERASAAWAIARERIGKDAAPRDVPVVPLAHRYRADVVQRLVLAELEQGTPERIVRRAVFSLDALTEITVRHACARESTREQDARREVQMAHASRERPVDRSTFDAVAALVDRDPEQALRVLSTPGLALTADERDLLTDEARRVAALRGAHR